MIVSRLHIPICMRSINENKTYTHKDAKEEKIEILKLRLSFKNICSMLICTQFVKYVSNATQVNELIPSL